MVSISFHTEATPLYKFSHFVADIQAQKEDTLKHWMN